MEDFAAVQARLGAAWAANRPGSTTPHVVIALPSFGVDEALLSAKSERLPGLEHRFLHASLSLGRIPGSEFVIVTSQHPGQEVLDYYAALASPGDLESFKGRLHVLEVADGTPRSVVAKLLERPDLIDGLRGLIDGRLAMIEPWNVTEPEVELARRLGVPINGTAPGLWPLGFKSAGREMFQRAGVPVPLGRENVRDLAEVAAAIKEIRSANPFTASVVVKLDDSGAGTGNRVVRLRNPAGGARTLEEIRDELTELPGWYLSELTTGGIVEEMVAGEDFASPSVQLDITPDGDVRLLATHEQVLGGEDGQTFTGCVFPANSAYAVQLAEYGGAVGRELAKAGALGRFAVDFVAARNAGWEVYAIEVNLRKGGTTHPYAALHHLVPGEYDPAVGWVAEDGATRCYRSTDNLVDPSWQGLAPAAVLGAVAASGLAFDHASGTGVVLHMLSSLAVDGRMGLTSIGSTPEQVDDMARATRDAVQSLARDRD